MITFNDLYDLPLNCLSNKGYYATALCPFHNDKNPSFVIYYNTGYFVCNACGKRGFFNYLYETLTGKQVKKTEDFYFKTRNVSLKKERRYHFIISGEYGPVYDNTDAYIYLKKRNCSNIFIDTFGIQYAKRCKVENALVPLPEGKKPIYFYHRIMIPLRYDNKLVNFEGRAINKKSLKCVYPYGGTTDFLFNYDNLKKDESLIIVEGIFDLPLIWEKFTKNVTCTFGSLLSSNQKKLLKEFKNEIILFIDDDEAGHKMISEVGDLFDSKEIKIAKVPGKDPGESTEKEIECALNNVKEAIDYDFEASGLEKLFRL
ncbi:MAG: toprim domain-containing protein [Candidatus Lokiarchaeota archaeon]|nr:toprim domain-containing protein [Candidatus Lokiarchaeota archaeon]